MDLKKIGLGVVDCIGLVQDGYKRRALVSEVMKFNVLQNAENS
jgi:hypothetical protein